MSEQTPGRARSFGSVADAYDRGRPTYPRAAAAWLTGAHPATVLELGAGTGKLTAELVALGHDVHATDPDPQMLAVLADRLPRVRRSVAGAESIPLPDHSVDVVVAAQAFHWFDHDRALPEILRVLRPGGRLGLVWNRRDEGIPWVRRLGALIGTPDTVMDDLGLLRPAGFAPVEEESFRFWQHVDRQSIQDLVLSGSAVAVLDDEARAARVADALALYDTYGRGMDGMQVPWTAYCFRTVVTDRMLPSLTVTPADAQAPDAADPDGTDLHLIDFR